MKTKESRVALQYNSRILPELWLSLLKLMKRAPKNLPRASSSSSTAENSNFMALMEILNPSSFLLTCTATSLHTDSFRWPPASDSIATKNSEDEATEERNLAETSDVRNSAETSDRERNQEGTSYRERNHAEETKKEGETSERRRRRRFRSVNIKTSLGALMVTSNDSSARPKTDQINTKDGHKSSINDTEVCHHSQMNINSSSSSSSSSSSISASSSSSSLLQSSNSDENSNGAEYNTASSHHFMARISESEEISSRDIFFDCTVDEKTEEDDESMVFLNVSPHKIKPAEKSGLCSRSDHDLHSHYLLSSASSNLSRNQSSVTEKSMLSKHNLHSHASASSPRPNLRRIRYTDSSINIHRHLSSSPSSPYTRNNHSRLSSSPSPHRKHSHLSSFPSPSSYNHHGLLSSSPSPHHKHSHLSSFPSPSSYNHHSLLSSSPSPHHKHSHLSSFPSPSSYNQYSLLSSPQSVSTNNRHKHLSPSPPHPASKTGNIIDHAPLTSKSTLHQSEAMAKYSHDPCSDFVSSITEMIIAHDLTQREEDLEDLFQCYLHLNPPKHHPTIALAFLSAMADLHVYSSSPRE